MDLAFPMVVCGQSSLLIVAELTRGAGWVEILGKFLPYRGFEYHNKVLLLGLYIIILKISNYR